MLQAYLPDSGAAQRELTEWARQRVAAGGAPIKIRLVKGANLAMETVEAEMPGWHPAPYGSKAETDANFRRLLEYGCEPENAAAVWLGVASHNLFDVALALTLREANGVERFVEIEMLEGMANHQARAVREAAGGLLLFAPAVQRDDFHSAMAYLVRRLDENIPSAIPAGGVLAAPMAGNSVILKSARATAQTAWLLARQIWAAGVPRDVLHFFPSSATGHAAG